MAYGKPYLNGLSDFVHLKSRLRFRAQNLVEIDPSVWLWSCAVAVVLVLCPS